METSKEKHSPYIPPIWAKKIIEVVGHSLFHDNFLEWRDRTWKERLFTIPWRPLRKQELVFKEPVDITAKDKVRVHKCQE